MVSLLQVILGSALGGGLRYLCTLLLPMPIIIVNILGSLIIGYTTAKFGANHHQLMVFINVGILGGFTTFSSFSLETINYLQTGQISKALIYVSISVIVSLLTCFAGLKLGSI